MGMSSPAITHLSWGKLEVADHGTFKDAKLWPGGARAWDWSETGTRHEPGIQPADVAELLAGAPRRQLPDYVIGSLKPPDRLARCDVTCD